MEERVIGPLVKRTTTITGIFVKIMTKKYSGKPEGSLDGYEMDFLSRLDLLIAKDVDKKR